ncbi:MAG: enoyl-CoA hydratase/isomerase family protein [Rhodospirillales bacterium]|nr:enoyl-CoA hydratase/isomerase family protein [Rhodospirillales bacterium]
MAELIVERHAGAIALLRLNRPEARNALNMALRRQLAEAFANATSDPAVKAIVVTGNGEAFAAGADLAEMADAGTIDILLRETHLLWRTIAQCPKPVIAAVNGYALGGGCELAMHADIIVAGKSAQFGQPEVRVGIMPGAGGTQRLVRAVGKFKAMKILLTGKPVLAAEAEAMGLVSELADDDQVLPTALKLADDIARLPPLAVREIKEAVLAGMDATLETALALERKSFQLLFSSQDQKEGMKAFLEKRKPVFEGK